MLVVTCSGSVVGVYLIVIGAQWDGGRPSIRYLSHLAFHISAMHTPVSTTGVRNAVNTTKVPSKAVKRTRYSV